MSVSVIMPRTSLFSVTTSFLHLWSRIILAASTMNLTAYLLVLFAFRLSKTGYVVATRELSVVLSAFIGSLWFGEGPLAPLLIGAAVVFAGMICIATAT